MKNQNRSAYQRPEMQQNEKLLMIKNTHKNLKEEEVKQDPSLK